MAMAQELDDLQFWLPAEFLTDDDLLTDFKTNRFGSKNREVDGLSHGFRNSVWFSTDLSSPVPSAAGTAETESDEDEFVAELSRIVARSSLRDTGLYCDNTTEGRKLPGSPQSTLCGCKPVPQGESNFPSRVRSPQDGNEARRWDFLYAAAEEAARMRLIEETAAFYSSKLFGQPPKPSPVAKSHQNPNPAPPNFYWNQSQTPAHHTHHQLQAARFEQMKKQQMMKNGGVSTQGIMEYQNGKRNGGRVATQGLSMSGWHTLQLSQLQQQQQQHQPGSGMTAIFLGEPGQKKERIGTGVFMPRRFGSNSSEQQQPPRKKSGRSTVLLPDKVVHALNLNLNLDPIDVIHTHTHPRRHFSTHLDAAAASGGGLKQRNTVMLRATQAEVMGLPQEWTY